MNVNEFVGLFERGIIALEKIAESTGERTTCTGCSGTPSEVPVEESVKNQTVDANGLPWDERIHASTKTTNADGTWKKRRGVDVEQYNTVVAELKGAEKEAPVKAAEPVDSPLRLLLVDCGADCSEIEDEQLAEFAQGFLPVYLKENGVHPLPMVSEMMDQAVMVLKGMHEPSEEKSSVQGNEEPAKEPEVETAPVPTIQEIKTAASNFCTRMIANGRDQEEARAMTIGCIAEFGGQMRTEDVPEEKRQAVIEALNSDWMKPEEDGF